MNYSKEKNKGITLIALVITIIVLLILVGVSIVMLTGENGILTQAQKAKEETDLSTAKEIIEISIIGSYDNSGKVSLDKFKTEIQNQGGTVTGNTFPVIVNIKDYETAVNANGNTMEIKEIDKITGNEDNNILTEDSLGNQIIVPSGFKVLNPSDNVTDGIIIQDVSHTETIGSEFVWIPLGDIKIDKEGNTKTVTLNRYTFDENGKETARNNEPIIQPEENAVSERIYNNQELEKSDKGNITAINIEDFKNDSTINKGYYIGRYEARTSVERKNGNDILTSLTIKPSEYIYNYITQSQAATLSRNMYNDNNFTSDLINSYAWDTSIVFFQTFDNRENNIIPYSRQKSLNNDILAPKGTNDLVTKDVICNVYDIASNCFEWTTETCYKPDSPCVRRGGNFRKSYFYASVRGDWGITNNSDVYSFRPILYLK